MASPSQLHESDLHFRVGRLFTPSTPILAADWLAGRQPNLRRILDAIIQAGQHAVVFGERGVGKTSLVNVLPEVLTRFGRPVIAPQITCDGSDDFSAIWRRVFGRIPIERDVPQLGFRHQPETEVGSLAEHLPAQVTPSVVHSALAPLGEQAIVVIVMDEFDRVRDTATTRLFADTIKGLSDRAALVSLVLVGTADSVELLVSGHESVIRNLVQISLPRMTRGELRQIVEDRLLEVSLSIDDHTLERICLLSRGLPHYTHLLGLHAAWKAIDGRSRRISDEHFVAAIHSALEGSQQSVQNEYRQATFNPRKAGMHDRVLLACALAEHDEYGFFTAGAVRGPLAAVTGRPYDIPSFARHLKTFCSPPRGNVLTQVGQQHARRYRFTNPLLQPYAILRGVAEGLISLERAAEIVVG